MALFCGFWITTYRYLYYFMDCCTFYPEIDTRIPRFFFQNKVLTVSCHFSSVFCCPPVTQCICSGNFQFYIFHKPWPWLLLLRSYHCLWPYKILIPKKWYWFERQEYILKDKNNSSWVCKEFFFIRLHTARYICDVLISGIS